MRTRNLVLFSAAVTTAMLSPLLAAPAGQASTGKPLKIYILAGQSNMQGKANSSTVPRMALSPETKALHDKILDEKGEPRLHPNVSAVYFTDGDIKDGVERPLKVKKGHLSTRFGDHIGPELAFGITMDEAVDQPILIIKTAWGGKNLCMSFRPPSAGLLPFTPPKPGRNSTPMPPEVLQEKIDAHNANQGVYYRLMMKLIKEVLADPSQYSDAYDPAAGYEIAGFGWFQGFNDMIAGKSPLYEATADKPMFAEYTNLLAHLIRDVRKELNAPNMPAVIGVMGIGGANTTDANNLGLRKSQLAVAELPEFKGNVIAVETGRFWDDDAAAAVSKAREADALFEKSEAWTEVGTPPRADRIWSYTSFKVADDKEYEDTGRYSRNFNIVPPAGMENWLDPAFDTSKWSKGPAPIGKGTIPNSKAYANMENLVRSTWGEGNTIMMKTTFDYTGQDMANFRLCLRSSGSFYAYLNGTLLKDYAWWHGANVVRTFNIPSELIKQGSNELAFYGNIDERKGTFFNAVEISIEGLPKTQADEIKRKQEEIAPERIRLMSKGQSNQAYHYLGSAYTYSLIGEAMAKGLLDLQKSK